MLRVLITALLLATEAYAGTINLSGPWRLALDPENKGVQAQWFNQELAGTVYLPGCLQAQGFGEVPGPETKWWPGNKTIRNESPALLKYNEPGNYKIQDFLVTSRHYLGAAWYMREIQIPQDWQGKRICLFLERCHWESRVWVDGRMIGSNDSLAAPHIYDLTGLAPGKHRLALRIDNSEIVPLGVMPHSVSEQTQGTWNGVVGEIALKSSAPVWVESLQTFPDAARKQVRVVAILGNLKSERGTWGLETSARGYNGHTHRPAPIETFGELSSELRQEIVFNLSLGDKMAMWDEFHPHLYRLTVKFRASIGAESYVDQSFTSFGVREFKTQGTQFAINGRTTFLRGNVDCAVYPRTGYAPTSTNEWRRIWKTYREFGLNHARFHSWCPPKAAFVTADEAGIYLGPEVHEWSRVTTPKQEEFFARESKRILEQFGNHASFMMMQLGNEMGGNKPIFERLLAQWRADGRRLYSIKANSPGNPPSVDFEIARHVGGTAIRYQQGWPPRPEASLFITRPPQTEIDWRETIRGKPYPLLQHESAQFCSYPDVPGQLQKFTGYLRPAYLEIARDQLIERGMLDQVDEFVNASGKWQVELTREELEAALRTPGLGGFHWLCLNDFTGQNSALVGLTDPFWDIKPYVSTEYFRKFCAPTALLARLPRRVLTTTETFKAAIEVSHYGPEGLRMGDLRALLRDAAGNVVNTWKLQGGNFSQGGAQALASIEFDAAKLAAPDRYNLLVMSKENSLRNDWNFWVFPADPTPDFPKEIVVSRAWDDSARSALSAGRTVLLLPQTGTLKGDLPNCFTTYYWTSLGDLGGQSSAAGILMDPRHPLFGSFPTDAHANWQWWDLLTRCQPMILDDFDERRPWPKGYRPLIQPIDSWKSNRKLALVAEARIGPGKLLICSIDIENDLQDRPATRQFRRSLLQYLASAAFNPSTRIEPDVIASLFEKKQRTKTSSSSLPTDG